MYNSVRRERYPRNGIRLKCADVTVWGASHTNSSGQHPLQWTHPQMHHIKSRFWPLTTATTLAASTFPKLLLSLRFNSPNVSASHLQAIAPTLSHDVHCCSNAGVLVGRHRRLCLVHCDHCGAVKTLATPVVSCSKGVRGAGFRRCGLYESGTRQGWK